MWFKIYFWFGIVLAVVSLATFIAPEKQNIPLHLFLIITYGIALGGLYSFAFQKSFVPQHFWKYYFWFYVLLDLVYFIYGFLPTNYLHYFSFIAVYQENSIQDTIINTALDLPIIYAMYRLAWNKPLGFSSKKKEKKPFRWGMIQTALWGYSSVIIFFFFVISLFSIFPQNGSSTMSDQTYFSLSFIITLIFLPIFIFWLWVVIGYKNYVWNWWRTTLVANALLYSGLTVFEIFNTQSDQGSSGFDIIGILQLIIIIVSLYVFGKDQFGEKAKNTTKA